MSLAGGASSHFGHVCFVGGSGSTDSRKDRSSVRFMGWSRWTDREARAVTVVEGTAAVLATVGTGG